MITKPPTIVRDLYDRAWNLMQVYADRDELTIALYWTGEMLAYATVLRDVFGVDDGMDLITNAELAMRDLGFEPPS
ncbi:MAG TPA: hypothetical protein VII06_09540 [Chloroflexota bacterium]|jgi:hypothetical protein